MIIKAAFTTSVTANFVNFRSFIDYGWLSALKCFEGFKTFTSQNYTN